MNIFSKKGSHKSDKSENEKKRLSMIKKKVASTFSSSSLTSTHNSETKSGFSVHSVSNISLDPTTLNAVNNFTHANDLAQKRHSYCPQQTFSTDNYNQRPKQYNTKLEGNQHQNQRRSIQVSSVSAASPSSFPQPGNSIAQSSTMSSFQSSKISEKPNKSNSQSPSYKNRQEKLPINNNPISTKTAAPSYLRNSSPASTYNNSNNNSNHRIPIYSASGRVPSYNNVNSKSDLSLDSKPMMKMNSKYLQELNSKEIIEKSADTTYRAEAHYVPQSTSSNLLPSITDSSAENCDNFDFNIKSSATSIHSKSKSPQIFKTVSRSNQSHRSGASVTEFENSDDEESENKLRQKNAVSQFSANFAAVSNRLRERGGSFVESVHDIQNANEFKHNYMDLGDEMLLENKDASVQFLGLPKSIFTERLSHTPDRGGLATSQFPAYISMLLPNSGVFDKADVLSEDPLPKINDDHVKPFEAYLNESYTNDGILKSQNLRNEVKKNSGDINILCTQEDHDLSHNHEKEVQVDEALGDEALGDVVTALPVSPVFNTRTPSAKREESFDSSASIRNFFGNLASTDTETANYEKEPTSALIENANIHQDIDSISSLKQELKEEIESDLREEIKQEVINEIREESKDKVAEVSKRNSLADSYNLDDLRYGDIIEGIDRLSLSNVHDEKSEASSINGKPEKLISQDFLTDSDLLYSNDLESSKANTSNTLEPSSKNAINFFFNQDNSKDRTENLNQNNVTELIVKSNAEEKEYVNIEPVNVEKLVPKVIIPCTENMKTSGVNAELEFSNNSTTKDYKREQDTTNFVNNSISDGSTFTNKIESNESKPNDDLSSDLLPEESGIYPSQTIIRKKKYLSEIEALANESYDYSDNDFDDDNDDNYSNYIREHINNDKSIDCMSNDDKNVDTNRRLAYNANDINLSPENKTYTGGLTVENYNDKIKCPVVRDESNIDESEHSKNDSFDSDENISSVSCVASPSLDQPLKKKLTLAEINKMKTIKYVRKPLPKDDEADVNSCRPKIFSKCEEDNISSNSHHYHQNILHDGTLIYTGLSGSHENTNDIINPSSTSGNSSRSLNNKNNNNNFDHYNVRRSLTAKQNYSSSLQTSYNAVKRCKSSHTKSQANKSPIGICEHNTNLSKLSISLIKEEHFAKCERIYKISEVYLWLCEITRDFEVTIFTIRELLILFISLVQYHFPCFENNYTKEMASAIVSELIAQRCFLELPNSSNLKDEKVIQLMDNKKPSGILVTLTPCYSDSAQHSNCYSVFCPFKSCMGELALYVHDEEHAEIDEDSLKSSWIDQWNINDQELNSMNREVIELQSRIYDLVKKQHDFLCEAEYMVNVLGKAFMQNQNISSMVYPHSVKEVYSFMFEPVKPLIVCHRKYLFEPMKKIILSQGQYVFSGIFLLYRRWTKEAFPLYVKYIDSLSKVLFFMNFEKSFKRDSQFLIWLKQFPAKKISPTKLLSNHFFYGLVQYKNSLGDIMKIVNTRDPEYDVLKTSHKLVTKFCEKIDERLGRAQVHTLFNSFIWNPTSQCTSINFDIQNIELLHEEKVLLESKNPSSHQYNMILLNNSLFLVQINVENRKYEIMDKPLPIQLILFDIPKGFNNMPVENPAIGNYDSNIRLTITGVGSWIKWNIKFIKSSSRNQWINHINDAKDKSINEASEYMKLSLVASRIPMSANLNPHINRIIMDVNSRKKFISASYQVDAANNCETVQKVFCAISFSYDEKKFYIMGTDSGMFYRTNNTPWKLISECLNVTKIEYIPEALSIVYLADKKLLHAYCCDIETSKSRITSSKLSKKPVDHFVTGIFKGMLSIFYMKVKVESPIYTFSSFKALIWDSKRNSFKESFLMESFFIPVECFDWMVFNSILVFNTSKGFQIMDDNLQPTSLPKFFALSNNICAKEFEIFKQLQYRVLQEKTVASFSVKSNTQILLIFTTFAVFCNDSGFIANTSVLNFNINAESATIFKDKFLLLFNEVTIEAYDLFESPPKLIGNILGESIKLVSGRNSQSTNHLLFETLTPDDSTGMILELLSL